MTKKQQQVIKNPEFDLVIERHLRRTRKLRSIERMIAEDPGLVPELLEVLFAQYRADLTEEAPSGPKTAPAPRSDRKAEVWKVLAYFRHNGNSLATVGDMAKGTGFSEHLVRSILANSDYRKLFIKLKIGTKCTLWRERRDDDANGEYDVDPKDVGMEGEMDDPDASDNLDPSA